MNDHVKIRGIQPCHAVRVIKGKGANDMICKYDTQLLKIMPKSHVLCACLNTDEVLIPYSAHFGVSFVFYLSWLPELPHTTRTAEGLQQESQFGAFEIKKSSSMCKVWAPSLRSSRKWITCFQGARMPLQHKSGARPEFRWPRESAGPRLHDNRWGVAVSFNLFQFFSFRGRLLTMKTLLSTNFTHDLPCYILG